jgi:uncharacterized membrane protein YphA (DoxX/SURF4 family)
MPPQAEHAFWTLRVGYGVIAVLAGSDKFIGAFTDWSQYLWPTIPNLLNITADQFMYGVGVVEITVGLALLFAPWTKWIAAVLAVWLLGIVLNLVLLGQYYDVAARDLGLAVGAFALSLLAAAREVRLAGGDAWFGGRRARSSTT